MEKLFVTLLSVEYMSSLDLQGTLVSGIHSIGNSETVSKLIFLVRNSNSAYNILLQQLGLFIDSPIDERYDSPWDIPIAALLMVAIKADSIMAGFVAQNVLRHPNLWWAKIIARSFLLEREIAYDRYKLCESA